MSATVKQVEVKERPLVLRANEVRAILQGRKTQERIAVTSERVKTFAPGYADDRERIIGLCPYGRIGDRLWVREALRWANCLVYDADRAPVDPDNIPTGIRIGRDYLPMTHMPRWASRIALEITNVRTEGLQEISESDAKAEGVDREFELDVADFMNKRNVDFGAISTYRLGYKHRWDEVNSRRGFLWSSNPLVWVIEFKKL